MKPEASALVRMATFNPAEPLWQRVPTRDEQGQPLSDFMMIIPGLRTRSRVQLQAIVEKIEEVLSCYQQHVVFADLNLKLNVLWVTVRPYPGICVELPAALFMCIPEARLVAHKT